MSWCSDDGVGGDFALGMTAKTSKSGQNTNQELLGEKKQTGSKLPFIMHGIKFNEACC